MQQIKQSSINYIHNTDGVIKEQKNKKKRKKVQGSRCVVYGAREGSIVL